MRFNKIYLPAAAVLTLLAACHSESSDRLTDKQLMKEFADPSAEWRAKPFWAWNGKLDKDELLRQVGVLDSMGFGGYFMHSRVGLQTEYLGDEWFELTNAVADCGTARGMENYLYDEDRWPSGTAGGYVTQNPDFRMNFITMKVYRPEEFNWADSITAVFACKLDSTSYTGLRRLKSPAEVADVTAGESILAFFPERAADTDFVNGYSYVDAMNREATDTYISLTHDKYKEKCGGRIGTTIKGIFFDEPHRGPLFTAFSNDNANRPYMAPWTATLPEKYRETYGTDIIDELPRLFLHQDGATYDRVKWQYCNVAQQLFLDNFVKPLYQWCDDNGMELTGHVLHEDDFVSQVSMQGSLMRTYEFMHVPGIDILTQSNRNYWVAKQLQSVARQTGKKMLLSELDGCTGWQMTFDDYKEIGDWQALFGINLRCPHLSWYTMEGEAKRDYPASVSFQSGWYGDYKYVEDYYARMGLILSQGTPECGLLVVNPIESVMAQVAVDVFDNLNAKSPVIAAMQNRYADLFHWLEGNHIDFDYGDEEMMSRLAHIEKDSEGNTVIRMGEAAYSTVFVGNMATMRESTFDLLRKFIEKGGKIVAAGDLPSMVNVEETTAVAEFLLTNATCVPYTESAIVDAVSQTVAPMASVTDIEGTNIPEIYCQVRNDGDRKIYAFINMSRENAYNNVNISIPAEGYLSEWNCRDGKVYEVSATQNGGGDSFVADFAGLQEHIYMVTPKPLEGVIDAVVTDNAAGTPLEQTTFAYELNEPNVLPLDFATCMIDGKALESKPTEVLKVDQAIRRHFGLKYRGGAMLQPWFFTKYKGADKPVYGKVRLTYPFEIADMPQGDVYLCMETPSLFSITVNGSPLTTAPSGWWIDPCFKKIKLDASMLTIGKNEISIESPFTEDLNFETMYIIGNFGVQVDLAGLAETPGARPRIHTNADGILASNPRITTLPDSLTIGDITGQRLPFYSGTVSYRVDNSDAIKAIKSDDFVGACLKLRRGDESSMIAFEPYVAVVPDGDAPLYLDVVLTRRNTFGPLHQLPARIWAYGPEMFVSEGDAFTNGYVLFRSGLLDSPTAYHKK